MLISVIVPVYNTETYIAETIDSILNQTLSNDKYEIILVDDHSTDSTWDIIKSYGDKIKAYRHEDKNKGTASTLNTGFHASNGQWIKWAAADDPLVPTALEEMMANITALEKTGYNIKNAIFYTNYHITGEDGTIKKDFIEPKTHPDLMERYYGGSGTSMIHRSVFERCGLLDESYRSSEDYEFWLRATKLYGVELKHIPIFTVSYRMHKNQLTEKTRGENDPAIREKIKRQFAIM